MLRSAVIVIAICVFRPLGIEAKFQLDFEDILCPKADSEYLTEPDTYFLDDETHALVVNFTIIKELPKSSTGTFVLMAYSMGEYVVPSGIDITLPLCELVEEPIIMGPLVKVLGFTADNCPPSPGVYGSEGYQVPTDNFPDDFPRNKYMGIFSITDGGSIIGECNIYINVQ